MKRIGAVAVLVAFGAALGACSPSAAEAQVCVSGALAVRAVTAESGQDARTVAAPRADWELVQHDGAVVARGSTEPGSGRFRACSTGSGRFAVRFPSSSAATATEVRDKADDTLFEQVTAETERTVDLGEVLIDDAARAGAWQILRATGLLFDKRRAAPEHCWFAQPKACGTLHVLWSTDPDDDVSEFDIAADRVVVSLLDSRSQHVVIHEASHWLHYNEATAAGWPDVDGCEGHTADKRSSPTCAWTEGFADAAAAYVLGDTRYVFPDGDVVDFASAAQTAQWETGDEVHGRVTAALLQIWRDVDGGDWSSTLAMLDQDVHTIGDYYRVRARLEPGKAARIAAILAAHTITV